MSPASLATTNTTSKVDNADYIKTENKPADGDESKPPVEPEVSESK